MTMPINGAGRQQGVDVRGASPADTAFSPHHSFAARKNLYGGGLMALIGLFALTEGLSYDVGTLSAMGPGFFPAALGIMLIVTGAAIAATGRSTPDANGHEAIAARAPQWRGWFCIALGIIAFVVLGRHGGLLPATFAIVFISALGDRDNSIRDALLLSLAISVIAIVVFWWALQLQLPLIDWS